jgi:hypothetical protein
MMDRILKRPMFRMGGRSDDGIMSVRPKYQEGGDVGFFTKVMDAINPPSGKIISRIQEANEPGLSPFQKFVENASNKPLEFRTQAEASEFLEANPENIRPIKILRTGETINLMGSAEASETDQTVKPEITTTTDTDTKTQELSDNDLKTMYEDLLPLFKSELSADDDELKRQKYLELAKFGANILAQPGGDLVGSIGRAAAPSIEGLTRVAETRRRANQSAKAMALEAALKQADPGTIMKQVRDIMRLDPDISKKDALAKVLSTGSATKQATAQGRIDDYAVDLLDSDYVKDRKAGKAAAEAIEESNLGIGVFQKDPGENYTPGDYYIFKNGKVGKYVGKDKNGKDDFAEPGDDNF